MKQRSNWTGTFSVESLPPSLRGCVIALQRCLELIHEIDDHTFQAPSAGHGTVGAHLRHCIEYFRCFLAEEQTGWVEYDARDRDPELEVSRTLSQQSIEEIITELGNRGNRDLDRQVRIRQALAPNCPAEEIQSTVRREWMSLSDHTIHHLAIITQLIAGVPRESGNSVTELGVAFSTQAHRATISRSEDRVHRR